VKQGSLAGEVLTVAAARKLDASAYYHRVFCDGVLGNQTAPLQSLTYYSVDTDTKYQDLDRHLTTQPPHLKIAATGLSVNLLTILHD
jgi:hypothetical protein